MFYQSSPVERLREIEGFGVVGVVGKGNRVGALVHVKTGVKPASIRRRVFVRIIAKTIDFMVFMVFAVFLPRPLGPVLGCLYSLLADGTNYKKFRGQSIGKKLFGIQVVHIRKRTPISFRESALRNSPVAVATFFAIIPLWGWLIVALLGLPLLCMEVYLMWTVTTGHRLGDVMGDSEVVNVKRSEHVPSVS